MSGLLPEKLTVIDCDRIKYLMQERLKEELKELSAGPKIKVLGDSIYCSVVLQKSGTGLTLRVDPDVMYYHGGWKTTAIADYFAQEIRKHL